MTTFSETFSMAYSREPYAIALASSVVELLKAQQPVTRSRRKTA